MGRLFYSPERFNVLKGVDNMVDTSTIYSPPGDEQVGESSITITSEVVST